MTLENIVIEPMMEDFILWRCLHGGPLSQESIDRLPSDDTMGWEALRLRNLPLLRKIIRTYGTCAIVARDGGYVVGFLRFYPKVLMSLEDAGGLCLQQAFPAGPSQHLAESRFHLLGEIEDRTLIVHCMMTGSPFREKNPYQRKGIGMKMARALVQWAEENGWDGIEATAYEDLDILYAHTGQAGRHFWERLGFQEVEVGIQSIVGWREEFVRAMRAQAIVRGLNPEDAQNKYRMRLDLT